jgi:hypothetical protein
MKTKLDLPEFKEVVAGHAGAWATQVLLWRPAANNCSRRPAIGIRPAIIARISKINAEDLQ